MILALDAGTFQTAFTKIENDYSIVDSGIVENQEILKMISNLGNNGDVLVYEDFASYGMPIGSTTMETIKWNGRFIQRAIDVGMEVVPMLRKDVKMNLCHTMKATDSNIRVALVDRYATHDFKNGKGTKGNPDTLYGFKKDMYSSLAIGTTYIDTIKGKYK